MASAQDDTASADNPNSQDLPEGDQQVMSGPNATAANSAKAISSESLMSGTRGRPLRCELDIDDEVITSQGGMRAGSTAMNGRGAPINLVAQTEAASTPSDLFLATGTKAVTSDRAQALRPAESIRATPGVDAWTAENQSSSSSHGNFFTGVARAVSALPSAVEGMVTRTQAGVSRAAAVASTQDVDGYTTAQSGSPGDIRRPPSERNVPQTPLLDQRTLDRLTDMQQQAPHPYQGEGLQRRPEGMLHSAERASSTHSSDIQAEVKRQLAEFMALHEDENVRLQRQVEMLMLENRELRSRSDRERSVQRSVGAGLETSGLPGLGWFGRGIGSILGAIPKTGSPYQAMDLQPQKSPAPPPPPPSEGPRTDPQRTRLSGIDSVYTTAQHNFASPPVRSEGTECNQDGLRVPRALSFGTAAPAPCASAQPPPAVNDSGQGSSGPMLDPLSVVLTGMAQLQGVISELAASPKAGSKGETIKPGTATLPDLPMAGPEACLEFADWLHNSRPALADISDSSEELWENIVNEAGAWYSDYLRKPPLERLSMKPTPSSTILQPKWTRVSRRIEGMLIAAAPPQVKEELSAARVSGVLPVLCRLFVIYAPGGLSEREIGLKQIIEPGVANNPKEAVLLLRKWQRWCSRVKELGGTLPDSALRVKALERIVKSPLASHPDISFRVNLTRAALQIDSTPDDGKVEQLHAQLLSELELVNHRSPKDGERTKDGGQGAPKIRGVEPQDGPAPPPRPPKTSPNPKTHPKSTASRGSGGNDAEGSAKPKCSFYHGPNGCKKGNDCTFQHDWSSFTATEKGLRCKVCGAKGHRSAECRAGAKVEEKAKPKSQLRSSSAKGTPEVPQPPPPPNRDAMLKSMLADAASILHQSIPVAAAEVPASDRSPANQAAQAQSVTPGTPVTIETLTAQLESLGSMARGFEAKACRVDEVIAGEREMNRVLLDSGATHPVIPYKEGLSGLEKVSVTLAGDGKQQWMRTRGGTLVVPPPPDGSQDSSSPQTIIPLGALVESLGCSVTWSKRQGLRVKHPRLGTLKTGVGKNTCPYVQENQALELIQELEMKRLRDFEAKVQELECELEELAAPSDPTNLVRRFISTGSRADALRAVLFQPYLHAIPEVVKVRLAEDVPSLDEDGARRVLKRLPLPRANRRVLLGSQRWVVHLCSGKVSQNDMIKRWCHEHGCEILHLDIMNKGGKGWDLTDPDGPWSVLLWAAAAAGRIKAIFSSAPSRSWGMRSPSTAHDPQRTREDPWCSQGMYERAVRENLLLVQDMFLWTVASVAQGRGIPFLKEFPDVSWGQGSNQASFWDTTVWTEFMQWSGVRQRFIETGNFLERLPLHLCVGTNIELPDAVLPLGAVHLDPNRQWTSKFRLQIIRGLEGRLPLPNLERLDRCISDGLRASGVVDSVCCRPSDSAPSGTSANQHHISPEGPDDPEEQLIRMFEDDSDLSSSEEEPDDDDAYVVCAAQNATERRRQKELEVWRLHLENGHVPFRRDCQHCILGSAINMQHRRVKNPTSYTLSVDLFGPLQPHERGRDEESVSGNPHIKYGLVGAFRVPKSAAAPGEGTIDNSAPRTLEDDDHLSDYEPSEPGEGAPPPAPVHDTLGEVSPDLFAELFGDLDPMTAEAPPVAMQIFDQQAKALVLKLPWEDEVLPDDDNVLKEYIDELKVPVEQVVLRFVIGLKSKSGTEVTAGVQRLILHINRVFPVRVLHCDPGTEFTSDKLRIWLADQGVRMQNTLPTDKKSNGLVERTVGILKSQARTHLSSAGLSASYWPLAMRYACETHNRKVFGKALLPFFGQQVLHKIKRPNGSSNELMNKWVRAKYMAPHLTIPDGHVLVNDEGNLVASKGFKTGAVDPGALPDLDIPLPVEQDDASVVQLEEQPDAVPPLPPPAGAPESVPPPRRISGKSQVRFVENNVTEEASPDDVARTKLLDGDFSNDAFHQVAQVLQHCEAGTRDRRGDLEGRYILGAFCHGGQRGVTTLAKKYPSVVRFLNKFLTSRVTRSDMKEEFTWGTILLSQVSDVPSHRDYRNEWGSKNFLVRVPGNIELWTRPYENPKGAARDPQPDWTSESVRVLGEGVEIFDARDYHAVRRRPDWFLVGYTPLGIHKLEDADKELLHQLRFRLPVLQAADPRVMAVRCDSDHDENKAMGSTQAMPEVLASPQSSRGEAGYQVDINSDLQEDSVTPIVGWDPTRDPANVPELNLEEMCLESFLAERGVSGVYCQLSALGVESPADLPFLYREDLIEFGIPALEATLIMKGIHPTGTLRPDNPNLCALRSGEVRLLDRKQRPIPWVFQNRTLDWHAPPPPLPGLGVREQGVGNTPRLIDWELQEARRRGELPDLFEEPEEYQPDPTDSPRSQVGDAGAASSTDPLAGRHAAERAVEEYMQTMYMQDVWDDQEEWPSASSIHIPCEPTCYEECFQYNVPCQDPVDETENCDQGIGALEEYQPDPTDSPSSQVQTSYACRAVESGFIEQLDTSRETRVASSRTIGVPTANPLAVLHEASPSNPDSVAMSSVAKKVDESLYTENVEQILADLKSHLRVVYTVSPAEVRTFLDRWIPAAKTEVDALVTMNAIQRLSGQEALDATKVPGVQVLPAKTVFTVKPDVGVNLYKRKCRVVGCGNFESRDPNLELYASGVPADVLRACLVESASKGYDVFITDVKNAFLRADIPADVQGRILLRPPRILELMNITVPGEIWTITKAVYGLRQSPRWWGTFRDERLRTAEWDGPSGRTRMRQSKVEGNLWTLVDEAGTTLGLVIIYVDDIMYMTTPAEARAAHNWLKGVWECTELEQSRPERPVTFLGVDIHVVCKTEGAVGFSLGQEGYIKELIRSYGLIPKPRQAPLPREWVKDLPQDELDFSSEDLRQAQKITGELLWLSQRTRLDLAYSVSLMGSWSTKAPRHVLKLGLRILEYVQATSDFRLSLVPLVNAEKRLVTYTDASFSPYGSHSVTGVVIEYLGCPVQWKAKRQNLISLSTAEAELISGCEGITLTLSMESLVKELAGQLSVKRLLVDNTAAIALAEGSGTMRTRHLRVRANFVREMLEDRSLELDHCPGDIQLADILTKVLQGPRHQALCSLLGLGPLPLQETVAAVLHRDSGDHGTGTQVSGAAAGILILTILLQALEGVKADDSYDDTEGSPVSLDLYVLMIMMLLSILFLWECGKHCLRMCCARRIDEDVHVNMVRHDEDQVRRSRRQEAVRRAIEREAGELRFRGSSSQPSEEVLLPTEREVPRTSLDVSVNLTAPAPISGGITTSHQLDRSARGLPTSSGVFPSSSADQPSSFASHPSSSADQPSSFASHPSSSTDLRLGSSVSVGATPLIFPSGTSNEQIPTQREIGTQTDFYQGLTYQQMCEIDLLTTSGRTPSAVHLFPNCHALRNVTSVQRRAFCRYCITQARQGL